MRRRNAVMAALSLIFIVILLTAMVLAVSSGITSFGVLVFGGFSYAILVGLVILAFPILIFVAVTIVLLTMEAARSTRRRGSSRWSRGADATARPAEAPVEKR